MVFVYHISCFDIFIRGYIMWKIFGLPIVNKYLIYI